MKNGKLDRINLLKYLMVVLLIIYVVFLVTREGDNTVSVDTIEKNITKAVKLEGMKKGTTQDLKKYYSLNANDYEGISLYIPDDVMSVNEILVIKVKNESQIETVEKAVESRVNTQEKNLQIVWSWVILSRRDCTNMVFWIRQMYRQTVEPACRRGIMKNWQIILPGQKR